MQQADESFGSGDTLANQYRLVRELGGGGMGRVWMAQHVTLGHDVAIKVLHTSVMSQRDARARFEREARLMARLGEMSRHIARVTDVGVLPEGRPYFAMELLRGEGLDAALRREKKLSLALTAQIVNQLCKALTVAHAVGVTHRDIKPANIFLCVDEDGGLLVKLLDFGVAKAGAAFGDETSGGHVIGTPNYMAPEQLTTDIPADSRADLFAVGGIAYRCVVGRTAFGTAALSEMAMRILTMVPRRPTSENPQLPAAFDAFIEKALAKRPEDRFQTARELADALDETLGAPPATEVTRNEGAESRGTSDPSQPVQGEATQGSGVTSATALNATAQVDAPRSRMGNITGALIAVFAVVMVVGWATSRSTGHRPTPVSVVAMPVTSTSTSALPVDVPLGAGVSQRSTDRLLPVVAPRIDVPTETPAPVTSTQPNLAAAQPAASARNLGSQNVVRPRSSQRNATPPAGTNDAPSEGPNTWEKRDEF